MLDLDQLKSELLQECRDDHVGLWSIVWQVRYALNDGANPLPEHDQSDPAELRRVTMKLVQMLLDSGWIQAGFPTPDGCGFAHWALTTDQSLSRITREWDTLGREPNIGDIVWFTTNERGDKAIQPWESSGRKEQ